MENAIAARTAGQPDSVARYVPLARHVFAGSLVLLGALHVVFGEQVARMLQAWPAGLPGRPYWAHLMGALIALGASMFLVRGRERGAAVALAALLMVPVLGLHLPRAVLSGTLVAAFLGPLCCSRAGGPAGSAWWSPGPRGSPLCSPA